MKNLPVVYVPARVRHQSVFGRILAEFEDALIRYNYPIELTYEFD